MDEFNDRGIVSDKVQLMARGIYQEFEKMMRKYDEDVVKNLMPLVVNLLETIESSHLQAEEAKIELELTKEENDQLISQYDKEKNLKRSVELKYIELDDLFEGQKRELKDRIKSLESIVHIMELKSKNSNDYASRLEEKENEIRKDYSKLHDRYTELLKTHMDFKERNKIILNKQVSPNIEFQYPLVDETENQKLISENIPSFSTTNNPFKILDNRIVSHSLEFEVDDDFGHDHNIDGNNVRDSGYSTNEKNINSGEDDENASDNIFAMGKEVENLIEENNELLATKNALNIVKDDLINKVDELTSEQELLREEIDSLQKIKENLLSRIDSLEKDLRSTKCELTKYKKQPNSTTQSDEDEKVQASPGSRKRFTRLEMARVILERNEYKEKWLELQEAMRWSETLRAARNEKNDKYLKSFVMGNGGGIISDPSSTALTPISPKDFAMLNKRLRQQRIRDKRMREERSLSPNRKGNVQQNNAGVSSIWNFFSQLFRTSENDDVDDYDENFPTDNSSAFITPHDPSKISRTNAVDNLLNSGGLFKSSNVEIAQIPTFAFNKANQKITPGVKTVDLSASLLVSSSLSPGNQMFDPYQSDKPPTNVDGQRFQAYGWSLPITQSQYVHPPSSHATYNDALKNPAGTSMSIPIPIYCRPLSTNRHKFPGCKILCASPVDLSGGLTRDGGKICGASIFYPSSHLNINPSSSLLQNTHPMLDKDVHSRNKYTSETSNSDLKCLENELQAKMASSRDLTTSFCTPLIGETYQPNNTNNGVVSTHLSDIPCVPPSPMSTLLWVGCSIYANSSSNLYTSMNASTSLESSNNSSDLTNINQNISTGGPHPLIIIIDATDPANILDSFFLNYLSLYNPYTRSNNTPTSNQTQQESTTTTDHSFYTNTTECNDILCMATVPGISEEHYSVNILNIAEPSELKDGPESVIEPDINVPNEEAFKMSTLMPTMWIGLQNGILSVHSSTCHWDIPLLHTKLKAAIYSLIYFKGKVYAGLANGTLCIFTRRVSDGLWDIENYSKIDLLSYNEPTHDNNNTFDISSSTKEQRLPIRCIKPILDRYVWAPLTHKIYSIDPINNSILRSHSIIDTQDGNQISNLVWCGGPTVWVTFRLSLQILLINAITFETLQKINLQPFLTEITEQEINCLHNDMQSPTVFSHLERITAINACCHKLWIGTAKGTVITIPFSQPPKRVLDHLIKSICETDQGDTNHILKENNINNNISNSDNRAGNNKYKLLKDPFNSANFIVTQNFIPWCRLSDSQYSFHAHREAIKFLIAIPVGGDTENIDIASRYRAANEGVLDVPKHVYSHFLMLSGGQGYLDYRNDSSTMHTPIESKTYMGEQTSSSSAYHGYPNTEQTFKSTDEIINKSVFRENGNLENFITRNIKNSYHSSINDEEVLTKKVLDCRRRNVPHLIVWRLDNNK